MAKRQSLGTDGRGDHRDAHGHRLVDLQARAPADAQRHHADGTAFEVRAHVGDGASDLDRGIARGELAHGRRWRSADHGEARSGYALLDAPENLTREPANGVVVRHPVHGADENQLAAVWWPRPRGTEILEIDAGRNI